MNSNLEVISLFGARGSGKTTQVKALLAEKQRRRVFVYDLKDEYPYKKIRGRYALAKFFKTNWHKDFKISYVPEAREKGEHIAELSDICFKLAAAQKMDYEAKKGGDLTILIEEMSVTAPNQRGSHRREPTTRPGEP